MKKVLFVTTVFLAFAALTAFNTTDLEKAVTQNDNSVEKTQYHEGWDDGHCEGWKDVKGQNAYCPYPPYPPYPTYPKSTDSYKDGYNDGFKRGMSDARN